MKLSRLLFSNRTLGQTVVKNIFWLSVSLVFSRLIRLAVILYAARVLDVAGYGTFSFALAVAGFASIFAELGISSLFVREVAKDPSLKSKYVSTAFSLKLGLMIIVALVVILVGPLITPIPEAKGLMALIALFFLFDGLRDFGFNLIRGLEKMEVEAGLSLITNLAFGAVVLGLLIHSPTPYHLTLGYVIGSAVGLIATTWALRGHLKKIAWGYSWKWVKLIATAAWPLALYGFFLVLLSYWNTLMLGWLSTPHELGLYAAAQKPVQFLEVLPAIFAGSMLPALSRLVDHDANKFRSIMGQSLAITVGIALPLAVGGILMGDQVITLMYGQNYSLASPVFIALIIAVVSSFPFAIIQSAILAGNLQKQLLRPIALGTIINLALNFWLIPRLGALGAGLTTLAVQVVVYSLLYYQIQQRFGFRLFSYLKKIIPATLIMGLVIIGLQRLGVSFWLSFPAAIVVYFATLVIAKETLFEKLKTILTEKDAGTVA